MGADAVRTSDAARAVFEAADAALGFPLSRLCAEGPEEELRRTEIQQPAILATSIALLRMLEKEVAWPVAPEFVAGHSLGEYSALVASGAVSFEDAVQLVHARGRYMQEAVPEGRGAMAAVMGLAAEEVERACSLVASETDRVVSPANFNSPQQTVIAGEAPAVEAACSRAKEFGAKRTVSLAVSAPFHCSLMAPAAEKLALELDRVTFRDPSPAVLTNVEAEPNSSGERVPALLRTQVTAPVRFTEMVEFLSRSGVTHYLEIGPGRVLSGLVARIDRRTRRASLSTVGDLDEVREFLSGLAA